MKRFASIVVVLAVGLALAALAQDESRLSREGAYWVETMHGEIARLPVNALRVETVGKVVLRGDASRSPAYTLTARVKARDEQDARAALREITVKSGADSDRAYLMVRRPQGNGVDVELAVSVPRALRQVWVGTQGGDVRVFDLEGALDARSGGGDMDVTAISGPVEIRTGGGNIQVGSVASGLRCFSGGGKIQVESVGGEAWLETGGGEIVVRRAMAPVHAAAAGGNVRIDRSMGAVYASTAGGLIQVEHADGLVTAESSGGAIQVGGAKGVRCDSAGGGIQLRGVAGALNASTNAGSILAELAAGRRLEDSMLSTRAGDITVLIPSNFPVTVMARNGMAGRIMSDFPEIRVQAAAQFGAAPVSASGALNGGGPVLHIDVMGGTIYLKRK